MEIASRERLAPRAGIGLRALRETAHELGGKLEVESGSNGTKLVVSVAPFPVVS